MVGGERLALHGNRHLCGGWFGSRLSNFGHQRDGQFGHDRPLEELFDLLRIRCRKLRRFGSKRGIDHLLKRASPDPTCDCNWLLAFFFKMVRQRTSVVRLDVNERVNLNSRCSYLCVSRNFYPMVHHWSDDIIDDFADTAHFDLCTRRV